MSNLVVGNRVEVTGKGVQGTVAFIGATQFSPGKWIGVILDEPKGKNNGTIKGKQYFQCQDNYGMFVRQMQLTLIDESGNRIDLANSSSVSLDDSSNKSSPAQQRSRLSSNVRKRPEPTVVRRKSSPATKITMSQDSFLPSSSSSSSSPSPALSSRLSLASSKSSSTPTRSREDVRTPTTNMSESLPPDSVFASSGQQAEPSTLVKRASFVELTPLSSTSKTSKLIAPKVRSKYSTSKLQLSAPKSKSSSTVELSSETLDQQTGFVETLKPQFTPGQVLSPVMTPASTHRPPPGPVIDVAEHEALKEQVKDLSDKLETLKIKYKEKNHLLDTVKIQLDQAAEFKIKIMESQSNLKKEVERLKKEKQEALEAKDEFSDIAETLEMATLDKEMAEERAETLQIQLEQAEEKIEELSVDLEIMKAEMEKLTSSDGGAVVGDGTAVSNYQLKQLEQQNIRLRDTLVRMRDVSAHEKHETQKLQKELEERRNQINELTKNNEKLSARCAKLEEQVADLHEQVDAALGAEEMVEQLSLQKLVLEENVNKLQEEVFDLEALKDISDQLQEDSRELELQLRQDVDLAKAAIREVQKEKEAALEMLADRELTIVKFRELVQKLQERCQELQHQLDRECNSKAAVSTSIPEMLDYKKIFVDSKALARAIDLELTRMEVKISQRHIHFLQAYMPDSFMSRNGDNDAVLTLLLIPRLIWKSEILISQTRDKFPSVEIATNREEILKGHSANQFAARSRLCSFLYFLQAVLRQFLHGLNTCSPDLLMKVAAVFPEMNVQERTVDGYIESLRTNQLDENINTDALEKCVMYFSTMHPILLLSAGETKLHQGHLLSDYHKAFASAIDSLRTDATLINAIMKPDENVNDVFLLCQHLSTSCEVMLRHLKPVRSLLSSSTGAADTANFGIGELFLQNTLSQAQIHATKITKIIREIARTAFSSIVITGAVDNDVGVDKEKILEIASSYCDRSYDDTTQGPVAVIKNEINALAADIANLAQSVQELDPTYSVPKKDAEIIPPIMLRAKQVKNELEETKELRSRIEARDNDIRELKMTLRAKQEEIGELSVRKELAEKKLSNTIRDSDFNAQKLQRKLEESMHQHKREVKELEETLDHLQSDIDTLESEKAELKEKVKNYSKKSFIESAVKSVGGNLVSSPLHSGSNVQVIESPLLLEEIKHLHKALSKLEAEKTQIASDYYLNLIRSMKPLTVPKKSSRDSPNNLDVLIKKVKDLQKEIQLNCLVKVPDLSKRVPGTQPALDPVYHQFVKEKNRRNELQKRADILEAEIHREMIKRKPGSGIETDLQLFSTPEMKKVLEEEKVVTALEINVLGNKNETKSSKVKELLLTDDQLQLLQQKLFSMSI